MIWRVSSLLLGGAAISAVATTASDSAQLSAADCRMGAYIDYKSLGYENETELYSDCVRQGLPLTGRTDSDGVVKLELEGSQTLRLEPDMPDGWLMPYRIGTQCVSRMIYDELCSRNTKLFQSVYGELNRCPLPSFYSASEADEISIWLHQMGVGEVCSSYATSALLGPLQIGPGNLGRLDLMDSTSRQTPQQIVGDFDITGINGDLYDISDLVVDGYLTVNNSTIKSLSLSNVVILGPLTISSVTVNELSLEDVYVMGDIIVDGISLSDANLQKVRAAGKLQWTNNSYRPSAEKSFFIVDDLDIEKLPVFDGNRTVSGSNPADSGRYTDFMSALKNEVLRAEKYRAEGQP
ncbi:hypothetical protein NKJ90_08065 [Mesorhizobium sp. M0051]|uniref:hypothetical protein n=1 Tax=Mesorhizobium sp. M0051 TaxID=2956862 RepID=UPI00333C23AD